MGRRTNNQLPTNLPQLQNLIKRDPASYKEEFFQQFNHFKALLQVFQFNPALYEKNFVDLVLFIAQVSHCYLDNLKDFPNDLINILKNYGGLLHPDVRVTICKALILLRNKSLLSPTDLLPHFIDLFRHQNKQLRDFIKTYIVTDIKNMNSKHHDMKQNSALQNVLFTSIKDNNLIVSKASLDTLIELYHKNIWRDAKCVNVIANCCFSKHAKMLVAAQKFFLGNEEENDDDSDNSDSESEGETNGNVIKELSLANRVNKSTRKRKKILDRTKRVVKKSKKSNKPVSFNFSAIHLIYDPQGMAEKLFQLLEKVNHRFEIKLMTMNLISRLIGLHQLFVFNFYPYLQRYLQPHQREVTKILLYTAQSAHELVPPEIIFPVVKGIANNFITERNSSECMCVGLNSIREICSRCPLAMDEDLLQDLTDYKSYKNKNVSMAAKSLIQLYRTVNPELLKKKDRGKPTEASQEFRAKLYGELDAKDFVPGAECLNSSGEEDDSDEIENKKDDESDGWIDVSDDEGDIEIDTSEDDEDNEGGKKKNLTQQEAKEKASHISTTRILSGKEIEKIKAAQLAKQIKASKPKRFQKNDDRMLAEAALKKKETVSINDIERLYKKPRNNKESRLSTIMEGREDREKFGGRKPKMNPFASKNEKEKRKNKPFAMIKPKIIQKRKRSFKDKAAALKRSLVKKLKNSK